MKIDCSLESGFGVEYVYSLAWFRATCLAWFSMDGKLMLDKRKVLMGWSLI